MENVDKTINAICDRIQKNSEEKCSKDQTVILPEMVKALASLVEARAKVLSSAVKESKRSCGRNIVENQKDIEPLREDPKDGVEDVESRISVVNTLRTAFKIVMVLEEEKIPYGMFEEVMESVKSIIAFTPVKHNPSDENHFSFPK